MTDMTDTPIFKNRMRGRTTIIVVAVIAVAASLISFL